MAEVKKEKDYWTPLINKKWRLGRKPNVTIVKRNIMKKILKLSCGKQKVQITQGLNSHL